MTQNAKCIKVFLAYSKVLVAVISPLKKVTVSQVIAELHEINSKKELDNLHSIPLKAL